MTWYHIARLYILHWSTTQIKFLFVFKKMPNNDVVSQNMIVCTELANDHSEIFACLQKWCDTTKQDCMYCTGQRLLWDFCLSSKTCQTMLWHHKAWLYILHWSTTLVRFLFIFKEMPNNGVTPLSMIVRTALVNISGEIFVCLQKDAKQCCDAS